MTKHYIHGEMPMSAPASLFVIKYGGHAMDVPYLAASFVAGMAELHRRNMRFVIVHGGGPQINDLLKCLDIKNEFVDGLRITDTQTLSAVEMALCGKVNKSLVRQFAKAGLNAAGISGEDGNLLIARQKDARLGRVGSVERVDPGLVETLLKSGFLPVIAPLALDAEGNTLNVNADTAAGAIAGALHAKSFILISDVPGILDEKGRLFSFLTTRAIADLRREKIITGGMIPKVEACLHALSQGCENAIILDGSQPDSLKRFLLDNEPLGTTINL